MNLIAFIGHQTAGKTTAAKLLESHYGWSRTRFAGPIRNMLRSLGLGDYELEGEGKTLPCALLCGQTPVWAMQTLGTEWGRGLIHPDFWVDAWGRQIEGLIQHGGKLVVDDLRFPNEAHKIRSLGGKIIRIVRPGIYRGSDHSSEDYTRLIEENHVIHNDGSLAALEGKLVGLLCP